MTDAKPAAKKAAKPKAPAAHPKYSVMIAAAIAALKDRTGSSRQAILKYICANYKVDAAKAGQHLRMALKAGIKKGTLKMAKESGKGAGCFKLVKVEKPIRPRRPSSPRSPLSRKPRRLPPRRLLPSPRRPLPSPRRLPLRPKSPLLRSPLPKSPLPRKLPRSKGSDSDSTHSVPEIEQFNYAY